MSTLSPEEFVNKYNGFDYLVVGGGTAGLVIAARLSEDPNITVGVLEAGSYHHNDPLVDIPGFVGRALGNPKYDWAYYSVPQKHINDRSLFQPRGKMLGGSSGVNFMTTVRMPDILTVLLSPSHPTHRASKEEYDAFEALKNPGWNWNSLLGYFKKSETAHPADKDVHSDRHNAELDPDVHGTSGPMHNSFANWASDINVPFFDALEKLGVPRNPDAASGLASGSYTILSAVDPATSKRSYTAPGYYAPNASRPNLVVLTSTQVTKLILTGAGEPYTVSGVQFTTAGTDKMYEVRAKREVILSAGAFGTPQLLELSGIGRREVLERAAVEVKVDLPGVGENLQDHVYVLSLCEMNDDVATFDALQDPGRQATETQLYEQERKGMYSCTQSAHAYIPATAVVPPPELKRLKREIRDNTPELDLTVSLKKQKALLEDWLDDDRHPQIELISWPGFFPVPGTTPRPGVKYHAVFIILLHALSRGSVHITSGSPFDSPSIDPNYLASHVDRDLLVHATRFVKKLHDTEPLKNLTRSYVEPAWEDDAADGGPSVSDEKLGEFIKSTLEPIRHPAGTAAMFPREEGGVVDPKLKVYGTTNLRIIDASVIPIHIAAHPMATIIAMAEKAADIFKADVSV
ncbi:alcohol oxidase [Clavulina sp. PMI_390]|nr:alcohol oxidase [Clavulina sp. PMI_390]